MPQAILLPGIIVPAFPMFAVFADAAGDPVFEPVACLGVFEFLIKDEKGEPDAVRKVAGFSMGKHVQAADFREDFVGYAHGDQDYKAKPWADRCAAKRKELDRLAKERAASKLYVPAPQGIIGGH